MSNSNSDSIRIVLANAKTDSARAYNMIALAWQLKYDSASAAQYLSEEALKISANLNDPALEGKIYNQLGVIHSIHGDYIGSINYYIRALEKFEQLNDEHALAMINNNIGMLFYQEKSYVKALEHFKKSFYINKKNNDLYDLQTNCTNIGDSYRNLENYDSALKYTDYGLEINLITADLDQKASLLMNKGLVYDMIGDKEKALACFEEAYLIDKGLEDREGMCIDLINIALVKMNKRQFPEAEKLLLESERYAIAIDFKDHLAEVYLAFIELYSSQNNYKAAFEYENKYIDLHDSLLNANMKDAVEQIEERHNRAKREAEFQNLKKTHELQAEQHKLEIARHQMTNYAALGALIVLLGVSFLIYRNNIQRKNANALLQSKNLEIANQKFLIEQKNNDVMDSIEYAKKIQFSILPEHKIFDKYFSEYFIFYKPKDIVSGDFYWAAEKNGKIYFAVVDCTGHGVPGAFMSILAYNGLNRILNENETIRPGQILDRLHFLVRDMQKLEEGSNIKEGMDLALCSFDPQKNILEFAGALNPLVLIIKNDVVELDANRRSIASSLQNSDSYYRNYIIKLESGDMFYMFTDGFQDQFGGPKGKKVTKNRLKNTLRSGQHLSMIQQGKTLEHFFDDWRGEEKQIDDVCVIGIKV